MAIVYSTTTKTNRMNTVVSDIGASGKLKLYASDGTTLLATATLAATAGTVTNGVLTLSDANGAATGILDCTASGTGTIAKAAITTAADVVVITNALTVGASAADIILDNPAVVTGQTIILTTGTITHG